MPTQDDYAKAIIAEGQRRGISARGITIAIATAIVESSLRMYANKADPGSMLLPHDAVGSDANSVGLFQQRDPWWVSSTTSDLHGVNCRMDAACSAGMFYDKLETMDYDNTANSPGSYAQRVQQSAFPDRYDQHMGEAVTYYGRLAPVADTPPAPRPDFNEYPRWCDNTSDRGGTTVDLWLIHTQEGGGNADSLASFLISTEGGANPVSYHYTISEDQNDHGVTVCDCADTDEASWSVGDANSRSINLCFAGSTINWSTSQWMQQSKAIDVAAYLCVCDATKYGFDPKVIVPPYLSDPPGVSDHKYVTQHLGWGTHTDVGFNFPWPYFQQRINYWQIALQTGSAPPAALPDHPVVPYDPTQNAEVEVLGQVRGRWAMLGGQTLVEAVAEIRDKVLGTADRNKPDFLGW